MLFDILFWIIKSFLIILGSILILMVIYALFVFDVENEKAKCEPQKNQTTKSINCQINDNLTK